MPLLDAVKGIACLLIVGHHLVRYGPLAEGAASLAPAVFGWLAEDGRLAVQVFLVIAGFLAAVSLAPAGVLRGDRTATRMLMLRYGRLVMPYLAALTVSVLVAAAVRPWLDDASVPDAPSLPQLIAHGLLLQDLLGYEALSAGIWYVAIDFQLFALTLAVFGLAGWMQRRWRFSPARARWLAVALVLGLVAISLAVFNRRPALDATAIYFFGAYGLGMLSFWIGRATRASSWRIAVALLGLLGVAALALDWRSRIVVALVTALAIVLADHRHWLAPARWPTLALPLLQVGRISYALFLIHFPVILAVNAVVDYWAPQSAWIDALGLLAALVLSVAAAVVLYRQVETRPASWRLVLGLFAGLLACGAIVAS
ncbi:acyltransferase family protein [Variovorax sp. J22G21]|uniref:acyltransferase family protein n=1 Tax=Variovorax fucosicus TaxID=3053517 RepID=UPI002578B3DD|nr:MULTISPECIES: acyltransferase family protein [unclassified Variovorax]MDM0041710.1 acyltransferase family protein [Variovorax sp. J22R193]MDM0060766.1 acyltransferase family protein [Variovorax sp. J22G21]